MFAFNELLFNVRKATSYQRIDYVLRRHKFENPYIGPINDVASTDFFVISLPKTATTSIQRSLEARGHRVIHAHNTSTTYDAFVANGKVLRRAGITLESLVQYRLAARPDPIYMFFGYRDPVTWYLSLAGHFGLDLNQDLKRNIVRNLEWAHPWNDYKFETTKEIVEAVAGVSLLDEDFDSSRGYSVIRSGQINVVLYRFDKVKHVADYVSGVLKSPFSINSERVNADGAYKKYVDEFKLPSRVLESLYDNDVMSFFYSKRDVESLLARFAV